MKCPSCSAEMKPLFSSFYCPKDCDKPKSGPDPWDGEDTIPYARAVDKCSHDSEYEGMCGNTNGIWCWSCGKLLKRL